MPTILCQYDQLSFCKKPGPETHCVVWLHGSVLLWSCFYVMRLGANEEEAGGSMSLLLPLLLLPQLLASSSVRSPKTLTFHRPDPKSLLQCWELPRGVVKKYLAEPNSPSIGFCPLQKLWKKDRHLLLSGGPDWREKNRVKRTDPTHYMYAQAVRSLQIKIYTP